jgi:hypothetical protein
LTQNRTRFTKPGSGLDLAQKPSINQGKRYLRRIGPWKDPKLGTSDREVITLANTKRAL